MRVVCWDSLKSESSSRDEPTKLFTGKGVLKKLRTTPELSDNESLPGFVLWSHHSSGNTQDFQCFPPQSNTILHHSLCSCGVNTDGFCGVTLSNPYLFFISLSYHQCSWGCFKGSCIFYPSLNPQPQLQIQYLILVGVMSSS